jgi:hypothetical protein
LKQDLAPVSLFPGKNVMTLSPENLLLVLGAHGSERAWPDLEQVCHIANLIELDQRLNWGQVLSKARLLRRERTLFLGLILAHCLLGAPLPDDITRNAYSDSAAKSLAAQARKRMLNVTSGGALWKSVFQARSREGLRDKIECVLAMAPELTRTYVRNPINRLLHPESQIVGFHPTSLAVADRMLALAQVGPADVIYDLGCGNGRIVVLAAKRYGARCVGVDVDPVRIVEAKARAREAGVNHLVSFIQQDAAKVDLSPATVVSLYMGVDWNAKILPILRRQLRPGTRIVSHDFDMGEWPPYEMEVATDENGALSCIYLWRIY